MWFKRNMQYIQTMNMMLTVIKTMKAFLPTRQIPGINDPVEF